MDGSVLAVEHCWDRLRAHHGPCCMACVIEETDRRAGVVRDSAVRETQLRRDDGQLVAVVRACCFHWHWQEDAVTAAVEREIL